MPAAGGAAQLVSTGKGRTTCAYYMPGDKEIVYASTHHVGDACPTPPDRSLGYLWGLFEYDVFRANADGSGLVQLTDAPGYDAEATTCADGSIIFTSVRDGDLELYRMDRDGKNVVRLTHAVGYDGGAFFSSDCKKIVWRASRPQGEELAEYKRLLEQKLVRPNKLEIYVANADGSDARQITYLDAASFAPYFFPDGKRVIFASSYGSANPRQPEFELWAVDVDGTDLERITYTPGFDGFPVFSPDGTKLAFGSNRNSANPHETDVYVARWVNGTIAPVAGAADQLAADVAWLADDAREGRGVGTKGLAASADWLAAQLRTIGLEPGMGESYKQPVDVLVRLDVGVATRLFVGGGQPLPLRSFVPAGFSASGRVSAPAVHVGWGIVAPELGVDDYKGKNVKGKIVVVRRFTPPGDKFAGEEKQRRYSDLWHKAFEARKRGAVGVVAVEFIDKPGGGKPDAGKPAEPAWAPLPPLEPSLTGSDAGIPVIVVHGSYGDRLQGARAIELHVALERVREEAHNVVGVIRAGGARLPGAVVVGAHYDHLGLGGRDSLEPGSKAPHNGADDNASGTAALLHVARTLNARRAELSRDVWIVAFTAEESGLIGSSRFVREPPPGLAIKDVVAMINMDMVGRMRGNQLSVLGGESAAEWAELVDPACAAAKVACSLSGSGYGPSDQTAFYAAGVPVLHFFTGAHVDYHKPSDDTDRINAAGAARVAGIVAEVAAGMAVRPTLLTYKQTAAPAPAGDARSFGASLGTIPEYSDPGPGVLLSGVRPGGPAEAGGVRRGDRIVAIGGTKVHAIQDMMFVLRAARPGVKTSVTVVRDGKQVDLLVTYGAPMGR
jgi:Tol biopolymer transport system component/membrane-associated protease RseP (regulator of RpoE activity)